MPSGKRSLTPPQQDMSWVLQSQADSDHHRPGQVSECSGLFRVLEVLEVGSELPSTVFWPRDCPQRGDTVASQGMWPS